MPRFQHFLAIGASLWLAACASGPRRSPAAASRPATQSASKPVAGHFGTSFTLDHALPVSYVFDNADELSGQNLLLEGLVEAVCQKKGCWLTLRDGDRSLRMSFKDYGFFVPKDLAGSRIRAEGVFSRREIPVAEARHYLEDAGRGSEAELITEPQQSYVFVADGVRLIK